jgi:hypothetical protein
VVAAPDADRAVAELVGRGIPAWVAGSVTAATAPVTLVGDHPG